jgi:hypothetical protein
MAANKEAIAKAPQGRVRRTTLGRRQPLVVTGKDPEYVYRVVNDEGDRVQRFLDAGYTFEEREDVQVGDNRVGQPSSEAKSIHQISVGGGKKGYLMKQRRDWYEEDQEAKQEEIKQLEAATKEKALDGNYGSLQIGR